MFWLGWNFRNCTKGICSRTSTKLPVAFSKRLVNRSTQAVTKKGPKSLFANYVHNLVHSMLSKFMETLSTARFLCYIEKTNLIVTNGIDFNFGVPQSTTYLLTLDSTGNLRIYSMPFLQYLSRISVLTYSHLRYALVSWAISLMDAYLALPMAINPILILLMLVLSKTV